MFENPNLRGMVFGYVGELRLREMFVRNPHVTEIHKYADHDRQHKNDLTFLYKGVPVTVECKSLDTPKIRGSPGNWTASFQCNASDSREVRFDDGTTLTTNCLRVGEFDLLAVNLWYAERKWSFAFARNSDLPRSPYKKYTESQRNSLLASSMKIQWPLTTPFEAQPWALLDRIIIGRSK